MAKVNLDSFPGNHLKLAGHQGFSPFDPVFSCRFRHSGAGESKCLSGNIERSVFACLQGVEFVMWANGEIALR